MSEGYQSIIKYLSSVQNPGWLPYIRGLYCILPTYMGIVISHHKDPYEPISIVECHKGFERCSSEKKGFTKYVLYSVRILTTDFDGCHGLASQGEVSLERVTFFVLDEADRMLECGFEEQVGRIGRIHGSIFRTRHLEGWKVSHLKLFSCTGFEIPLMFVTCEMIDGVTFVA